VSALNAASCSALTAALALAGTVSVAIGQQEGGSSGQEKSVSPEMYVSRTQARGATFLRRRLPRALSRSVRSVVGAPSKPLCRSGFSHWRTAPPALEVSPVPSVRAWRARPGGSPRRRQLVLARTSIGCRCSWVPGGPPARAQCKLRLCHNRICAENT
jgi:hypothetical protein